MISKREIGKHGEILAEKYLEKLGFIIKDRGEGICCYDLLCDKDNILYAINVKNITTEKGCGTIQLSNISRLLDFCKKNYATPVYFIIHHSEFIFLNLNKEFSNWGTYTKTSFDALREYLDEMEHIKILQQNNYYIKGTTIETSVIDLGGSMLLRIPATVAKYFGLKRGMVAIISDKSNREASIVFPE